MPSEKLLRKYARLAVRAGVHVQKGQMLIISAPVSNPEFVRMCQEEAYQAGAGEVVLDWFDDRAERNDLQYAPLKTLQNVAQWKKDKRRYEQARHCCFLHIDSTIPGVLKGLDPEKLDAVMAARRKAMQPFRDYTMASRGQWSIVAVPNAAWASKVFPKLEEKQAVEKLWNAIFKTVYLTRDNDPVQEWKQHDRMIAKHCRRLNQYRFQELHFVSELGTDLTVGLPEGHIWGGGDETAKLTKAVFNPNMPTEETFTSPSRSRVNGIVYASKPLNSQGRLIENFWLRFENGRVVDYHAKKEQAALKAILEADANSARLGEVALISYDSPISLMNLLFYDTLFDENASCHLALGASYPDCMKDGASMSDKELMAHDCNVSSVHVDFMFGTRRMKITGVTAAGREVPVFDNGNFVF